MSLRHLTQHFLNPAGVTPTFDPANFVPTVDNPYYPLPPGTTFVYESPDGSSADRLAVTRQTKDILGVTCVVVNDQAFENGELVEKTLDYFAQDKDGNVWYLGEDAFHFENGKLVSTEGTWRAGRDDQHPGIIMLAHPQVGDAYAQEIAPGVAEDQGLVVSLNDSTSVPYGSFAQLLHTDDTTPLEPGFHEQKFYGAGIGLLQEVPNDANQMDLVKIRFDGTGHADTIAGNVGPDELDGRGGNDNLNGLAGSDTITGGSGNDTLHGGGDQLLDILDGGRGNDLLRIGAGDQAFGGNGKDVLQLFDNADFAEIDGGTQPCRTLSNNSGDVLQFAGALDLTTPGVSERISGIETIAMTIGDGNDSLRLSAQDVLDLGDGTFDPRFKGGPDGFGRGDAVRIDGDSGEHLTLAGGNWSEIEPKNAPHGYDVFSCQVGAGNAYVLVQDEITVSLS
jgi:RTX calcium-binding nonapeptide repeat (4 copies)